jgi:hypothetical protein
MCCERCVFGTGAHADWCTFWLAEITRTYLLRAQEATAIQKDFDVAFRK